MTCILDFDVTELLGRKLAADRRAGDGLLHPSGDLLGSLRHAQLRAVGAPTIENPLLSEVRLATGTMWHSRFEEIFRGLPVMLEVNLTRWMPAGWSGTADWIQWSSEYRAFVLGDLKTIKPEGMVWVENGGIKEEHLWQVSSYWWALQKMGLPLVRAFNVYYLPMSPLVGEPNLAPLLLEAEPLPWETINPVMESRWLATRDYLYDWAETSGKMKWPNDEIPPKQYLNSKLAPVQERKQVIRWNKAMGVFDVKLEPHWSANYCPFPDELCDCRHGKREKIGHYAGKYGGGMPEARETDPLPRTTKIVAYEPRKGFEDIEVTVTLDKKQKEKLLGST